jgi:hypothetical protein
MDRIGNPGWSGRGVLQASAGPPGLNVKNDLLLIGRVSGQCKRQKLRRELRSRVEHREAPQL